MNPSRAAASLLALSLLLAGSALASEWDFQEDLFGATNVTAQAGNGGLTVGLAPRGEVTVLSWPSTTYFDQLEYETSNAEDAREQPFFGAQADQGIFGGLWVEQEGVDPLFTWLRDEDWQIEQRYLDEASGTVLMEYHHPGLALSAQEHTFVDLEQDVLFRRVVIKRQAGSQVTAVRYLLYENMAPTADKPVELADSPIVDPASLDDDNDFAAFWEPSAQALIHFAPPQAAKDNSLLTELMSGGLWSVGDTWLTLGLPQLEALLEGQLGGGVFLGIGGAEAPAAFQVGWQSDEPCDLPDGWTWTPTDAFDDVADGELDGSPLAACHVTGALAWDLDFGAPGTDTEGEIDLFVAPGDDTAEVVDALAAARAEGYTDAHARNETLWAERVTGWRMPDGMDEEVLHFSRRALMTLLQGTDRAEAAMAASIAVQPSYHHDRPRDSVLLDLGLDLAGEFDQVSAHHLFLVETQNREVFWTGTDEAPVMTSPPGAWFTSFYADGRPATTTLNPFEIDQVGLMLWGFWAHGAFAPNDALRRDVIASAWPAIERGAQLLSACVDPGHPALDGAQAEQGHYPWWPVYEALEAGTIPDADARWAAMQAGDWEALRPCEAHEGDDSEPGVSLYSTHTTRLGLLAAVRAAELLCLDDDPRVDYWRQRAAELGAAAFDLYYDAGAGSWEGRTDWLLWPEPLAIDPTLDALFSDAATPGQQRAEVEALQAAALDALAITAHGEVNAAVNLVTDGATWENRKTLSLARYWQDGDVDLFDANSEHIRQLAVDLPIAGTRHVGEVWVSIDDDGDGVFDRADQRTSTPHLGAATLTYLSAMAAARPELFEALESDDAPRLCNSGEEPLDYRDVKACSEDCQESFAGGNGSALGLLLLGLVLVLRRVRR